MNWKIVLRKNYRQLIFVFLVFLLMVLVSIISVNSITRRKLLNASEETMHTVEANIRMNLREPESTLAGSMFTVRNMVVNQNASQDDVLQYMTGLSDWLLEDSERVSGFNGIYGVVRGDYLDGTGWVPPAGYIPQERPWYIAAEEGAGEIAMTAPYIDAQTQSAVISISQSFYDKNGEAIGTIALDVMLTRLTEYIVTLQSGYGGYGVLLDTDLIVVAHPEAKLAGTPLKELSADYAVIAARLAEGADISGETIRDTNGKRMILFSRKLYNGWHVGTLTPVDSYYDDLYLMEAILISMGTVLMLALSFILMRLSVAKMRSDEENQSKSSFLARMSHEIRTPMNAILGMVELILRKDLPPGVRENAVAIKNAGINLLSIINDILDFSKIESNRMEIISTQYQFASLLTDVINIIRMRVDKKLVLFVVNIDNNLPSVLTGDNTRLRQVLLNLLTNAVKYTREGYVCLNVTGEIKNPDTIMLSFEVSDTGIGIHGEDFDKLFGDFAQFDTLKNLGVEGTGLGLPIANSLVQLLGGDITVSSIYGEGSVFTASLPQKIASCTPLATVNHPQSHNILVYETRMPYADSIVRTLHGLGVKCLHATDFESFAKALEHDSYTFIFAAPFLFDPAREFIETHAPDAVPVLLEDPGGTAAFAGERFLSMPAHCVYVANILNGANDAGVSDETDIADVQFTAPSARILIVDDVEINLQVAEGLISPYKMQIDCCASGHDAVEAVRNNDYDIVFMDHMMPEMDGIEAMKIIRAMKGPRFQHLFIVVLTANAVSGMREMFLKSGFNDYLAKPIDVSELDKLLHKWIPMEKRVKTDGSD